MINVDRAIRDSLIVDSASDWIWERDLITGEVKTSEAWIKFLGYDASDFEENMDFYYSLIHPDDVKNSEMKSFEAINGKDSLFTTEFRIKTKHNGVRWILSKGSLLRDENGKAIYAAGFHCDITPYRQLKESSEINRRIIELSPDGIAIHKNGVITYINTQGAKILGVKYKNELLGKNIVDFVHPEDRALVANRQKIVHHGAIAEPCELRMLRMDGTLFYGEVATTPLTCGENDVALGYLRDITEQKEILENKKRLLSEALELDKLKTEFFSNISHELRTPLNIILATMQLLNSVYDKYGHASSKFAKSYERYNGIIKLNGFRLLKLTNNLIDLTKLDSGFLQLNFGVYNIIELIENTVLSVAPYMENKSISLTFDTDVEEKFIACDEDKIERIILNLLSNAVKFTNSGGNIEVSIKNYENNIVISVKDTGCGIPKEKLDVIFDRFIQVDSLLTRRAEGSGIGLTLVKALIEAHKGTIEVKSTFGEGSEFILKLPAEEVEYFSEPLQDQFSEIKSQSRDDRIKIEFSDV